MKNSRDIAGAFAATVTGTGLAGPRLGPTGKNALLGRFLPDFPGGSAFASAGAFLIHAAARAFHNPRCRFTYRDPSVHSSDLLTSTEDHGRIPLWRTTSPARAR